MPWEHTLYISISWILNLSWNFLNTVKKLMRGIGKPQRLPACSVAGRDTSGFLSDASRGSPLTMAVPGTGMHKKDRRQGNGMDSPPFSLTMLLKK